MGTFSTSLEIREGVPPASGQKQSVLAAPPWPHPLATPKECTSRHTNKAIGNNKRVKSCVYKLLQGCSVLFERDIHNALL